VTSQETIVCLLPAEVIERWKTEHGLEGVEQRFEAKDAFGNDVYMKKKTRGRAKYYGQGKHK